MSLSAGLGIAMAGVGVLIESAIVQRPVLSFESADNVATGILTALLVFAYEQRRYQATLDKLRVVAAMNHHVRNALQAILSCRVYPEQERQVILIADAVKRIEWALREVLPGETHENDRAT